MILILGTVLLSVCSALLAVHLTQDKTSNVTTEALPFQTAESFNSQTSSETTAVASLKSAPSATPNNAPTAKAIQQAPVPQAYSHTDVGAYLDNRKPLSVDEVQSSLLKATPDCKEDYKKLCLGNSYLAEHPLACLRHQKDHLSRACYNQVAAVRDQFQKDCGSDIQRLCSKQSSYYGCLKQQMESLSPACRNNIQQFSRR